MPATTSSETTPILDTKSIETTYILYYRQGSNPHPQFLLFNHKSNDMKVISERAKRHCEIMSYRFVYVRPAYVDFDRAENFMRQQD